MKIAIRDDDTSYFTDPAELELVYKPFWDQGIPVSLAVVPFSVKSWHSESRQVLFHQETEKKALGDNQHLVNYLRKKIKENKVSIMLHGHTHEYKAAIDKYDVPVIATKQNLDLLKNNQRGTPLIFTGEYAWKRYPQLIKETALGKQYLEDIFGTRITVFIAPSNEYSTEAVKAISECGLNINGTMRLKHFNRTMTRYSMKNWLLKLKWRMLYGKVYPYPLDYVTHKEINAYGLVPSVSLESLKKDYDFCRKNQAPFVLATHYWEVKDKPLYEILKKFIDYTKLNISHEFVPLSQLF